ncbi:MAG: AMIN domain-containing protein [Rhizonema sp. PD37]|nr:AMIN domain-containing protein [Rhizonema sp. PD37]
MNQQLKNQQIFRWCRHGISLFVLYLMMFHCLAIASSKPPRERLQVNSSKKSSLVTTSTAMLQDWRFSPEASQLEITLTAASQPHYFYLSQPSRLVIDLPATKLGYVPTKQNYYGPIQSIRVSQLKAGTTRIVMDLAPGTVLNPRQVQLQPISWQNPTRWVLRPLITSERADNALRDPSQSNDLPPTIDNAPLPPTNLPPTIDNAPLSPTNLPPTIDNALQAPANLPPTIDNAPQPPTVYNAPQPPTNLPPTVYNAPQQPTNLPPTIDNAPQPPLVFTSQPLRNLAPATYENTPQIPTIDNSPQSPTNVPPTSSLPPLTTLPPTTNNFQQPSFISVPPLTSDNPSQLPNPVLPPASLSNQQNINSVSPLPTSNFPAPKIPNYSSSSPNSRVVEFGQPLTNSNP